MFIQILISQKKNILHSQSDAVLFLILHEQTDLRQKFSSFLSIFNVRR